MKPKSKARKQKKKVVKRSCKQKRYHNWEVVCVNGSLPYQELNLACSECSATAYVDISDSIEEDDG